MINLTTLQKFNFARLNSEHSRLFHTTNTLLAAISLPTVTNSSSKKNKDLVVQNKSNLIANNFKIIKDLLDNNTHDEELQLKIETQLYDSTSAFESNISNTLNVNFSKDTTLWLHNKKDIMAGYLLKMITDNELLFIEEKKKKKPNKELLNRARACDLIKVITPDVVAQMLISFFI